jgi:hypothetical protein
LGHFRRQAVTVCRQCGCATRLGAPRRAALC